MPVIRVDTTTTAIPLARRSDLLAKLTSEFDNPSPGGGPVIFEIPLGTECFDVLVVWQEWADLQSEERSRLILDAYGDKQHQVGQALGVTYEEAMQQQLLPYSIVSAYEEPRFASKICEKDPAKIKKLMNEIHSAKQASGGLILPNGKVELRFPTRAMLDSVHAKLRIDYPDIPWSVVAEVAASN